MKIKYIYIIDLIKEDFKPTKDSLATSIEKINNVEEIFITLSKVSGQDEIEAMKSTLTEMKKELKIEQQKFKNQ